MASDGLDLELLLSVHQVWRGSRKADPVLIGFLIGGQQGGVKYVVDGPGCRELELIGDGGDSFRDGEGAMTSRGQLVRLIRKSQVLGFQPDPISHTILVKGDFPSEAVQCRFHLFLLLKRRFLTEIGRRV